MNKILALIAFISMSLSSIWAQTRKPHILLHLQEQSEPISFTEQQTTVNMVNQMLRIFASNGKDTLIISLPKFDTKAGAKNAYTNNKGLQFFPAETAVISLFTDGKTYSTVYRSRSITSTMPLLQTSTYKISGEDLTIDKKPFIKLTIGDSTYIREPSNMVVANNLATFVILPSSEIILVNPMPNPLEAKKDYSITVH